MENRPDGRARVRLPGEPRGVDVYEILAAIHAETPILRAALTHFPPPRRSLPRRKPNPEPKTHIGTLIPGEI